MLHEFAGELICGKNRIQQDKLLYEYSIKGNRGHI